ncbi:MAG: methyltransferase domain-containing protein [Pyrinomonadaceae bacterium]
MLGSIHEISRTMQNTDSHNFKSRDASSYDSVTAEFDYFTERLTSPLAERLLAHARIKDSDSVLDIGTGTGVVALRAAQNIGPRGKVYGIDLSEGMLEAAAAKALDLSVAEKVQFIRMDAEELSFDAESFDVVVSLFALLHFPDPLTALREIFRVTRRGGRLVVAVGSRPSLFSLSGLGNHIKLVPDFVRRVVGKQLVAPGFLDSLVVRRFPDVGEHEESDLASHSHDRSQGVVDLVQAAGFKITHTDWQGHQAVIETPEEFWEIQRTFSSISRKRLGAGTPEGVEALRTEFLGKCRTVQSRGGSLVYPFAAYYVVANKPE